MATSLAPQPTGLADPLVCRAEEARRDGRPTEAVRLLDQAVARGRGAAERFELLLLRARAEAEVRGGEEVALATYWDARNIAKRARLARLGEADLGIGMTLIDLDRLGEGLEAVRRAARYFAGQGNTLMRGCAETVLAEGLIKRGEDAAAERHLDLAADLLLSSPSPELAERPLSLRASVATRPEADAQLADVC